MQASTRIDGCRLACLSVLLSTVCASDCIAQPTIAEMPLLPNATVSTATGVSGNGGVVCGTSYDPGAFARSIRWNKTDTTDDLGSLPGLSRSFATGISKNGQAVVGTSDVPGGDSRAFRWMASTGMVELPLVTGWSRSRATAANADGRYVVGAFGQTGSSMQEAVRWDEQGVPQGLGVAPGGISSIAFATSADGAIVTGVSFGVSFEGTAFLWTPANGMEAIVNLPGSVFSTGWGMSADGSIIVGGVQLGVQPRAFRWTAPGGMQNLGVFAGGQSSEAFACNSNGRVVVGSGNYVTGSRAMLWSETLGMVDLSIFLSDLGVDLTGWTLRSALSISDDGLTIVGVGSRDGQERGWIVRGLSLSQVLPCAGDFDGDRSIGLSDIAVLIQNWGQSGFGLVQVAQVIAAWNEPCDP